MRVPTRRSERLKIQKNDDPYLTPAAITRIRRDLDHLENEERPAAIAEVRRTAEMGDFSENAAYQIAKGNLRRINGRILSNQEQLKQAVAIMSEDDAGKIHIGSTVVLEAGDKRIIYQILGSRETNPAKGRISYSSPIGQALMGHVVGDTITVKGPSKQQTYTIVRVGR